MLQIGANLVSPEMNQVHSATPAKQRSSIQKIILERNDYLPKNIQEVTLSEKKSELYWTDLQLYMVWYCF